MHYYAYTHLPVGTVLLVGDGTNLSAIYWETYKHTPKPHDDWVADASHFAEVLRQLENYFGGRQKTFDIPYEATGTVFQKRVWQELTTIGFGETRTYQSIADAIGAPRAVRAVASAIGRNPLSIIVPCHRVIGSNGTLTGYAGGIASKRRLLELEGVIL